MKNKILNSIMVLMLFCSTIATANVKHIPINYTSPIDTLFTSYADGDTVIITNTSGQANTFYTCVNISGIWCPDTTVLIPNGGEVARFVISAYYYNGSLVWGFGFVNTAVNGVPTQYRILHFNNINSIAEETTPIFNVFPNPATESITISGVDVESVVISDVSGRTIKQTDTPNIDVSDVTPGIYFVCVNNRQYKRILVK